MHNTQTVFGSDCMQPCFFWSFTLSNVVASKCRVGHDSIDSQQLIEGKKNLLILIFYYSYFLWSLFQLQHSPDAKKSDNSIDCLNYWQKISFYLYIIRIFFLLLSIFNKGMHICNSYLTLSIKHCKIALILISKPSHQTNKLTNCPGIKADSHMWERISLLLQPLPEVTTHCFYRRSQDHSREAVKILE